MTTARQPRSARPPGPGRSSPRPAAAPTILLLAAAAVAAATAGGCRDPLGGAGYPLATFVCDAQLEVGVQATFDASYSHDRGLIEEYTFNFGDGSPILVTSYPIATHTYRAVGTYRVELEVIDDLYNVAFERRKVQVKEAGSIAACSGSCDEQRHQRCVNGRCRFTPAECRAEDSEYSCSEEQVCCHGYCELSCSD